MEEIIVGMSYRVLRCGVYHLVVHPENGSLFGLQTSGEVDRTVAEKLERFLKVNIWNHILTQTRTLIASAGKEIFERKIGGNGLAR